MINFITAQELELLRELSVTVHEPVKLLARGVDHLVLYGFDLLFDLANAIKCFERCFANGLVSGEGRFLSEIGDAQVRLRNNAPGIRLFQPGNHSHQGALAAAVHANQRDVFAFLYLERDIAENEIRDECLRNAFN